MIFTMILFDSDFVFSYFVKEQSTHKDAVNIVEKYSTAKYYISNLVRQELATVLSYKKKFLETRTVFYNLEKFEVKNVFIDSADEYSIWSMFWRYEKSVSFIDVSNIYLAEKYGYRIASFDKFYPKELILK